MVALLLFIGIGVMQAQSNFPPLVNETQALALAEVELAQANDDLQSTSEKDADYAYVNRKQDVYELLVEYLSVGNELEPSILEAFGAIAANNKVSGSVQGGIVSGSSSYTLVRVPNGPPTYNYADDLLQEVVDLFSL